MDRRPARACPVPRRVHRADCSGPCPVADATGRRRDPVHGDARATHANSCAGAHGGPHASAHASARGDADTSADAILDTSATQSNADRCGYFHAGANAYSNTGAPDCHTHANTPTTDAHANTDARPHRDAHTHTHPRPFCVDMAGPGVHQQPGHGAYHLPEH